MSDNTPSLGAITRQPRLSDEVADGILELIVTDKLKPGDTLPPERELGEQFGVSRTVIREAVRALDAKGLLEVRSGSRIRIAAVDARTAGESLRHFIRGSELDAESIRAPRDALLEQAAALAASAARTADLERLRSAPTASARHRALARASANPLIALLCETLEDALGDLAAPASESAAGWEEVVDAIERRDREAARRAVSRCLERRPDPDTGP